MENQQKSIGYARLGLRFLQGAIAVRSLFYLNGIFQDVTGYSPPPVSFYHLVVHYGNALSGLLWLSVLLSFFLVSDRIVKWSAGLGLSVFSVVALDFFPSGFHAVHQVFGLYHSIITTGLTIVSMVCVLVATLRLAHLSQERQLILVARILVGVVFGLIALLSVAGAVIPDSFAPAIGLILLLDTVGLALLAAKLRQALGEPA